MSTITPLDTATESCAPQLIQPHPLTRKDFQSAQEVKWCPGCGDHGILMAVQNVLPKLGIAKEKICFVSGIGCSSRFPYYLSTYGLHGIHGRAPAIAMGVKCARPDLSVWVVTGDGDGLSIGTNHLIHCLRRNIDLNILLLNNQIYGLTKGQYSPTSEFGKKTKSSPWGTIEQPISPCEIALAADATFVARSVVANPKHLTATIEAAARHKGVSFVEILQDCVVFNEGVLRSLGERNERDDNWVFLEPGQPVRFGANGNKGIVLRGTHPEVVTIGENGVREADLMIHDPSQPSRVAGHLLAGFQPPELPMAFGIFRQVEHPTYDDLMMQQINQATASRGPGDLPRLLRSGTTWVVD